jgi:hypothetical protein
LTLLDLLLRRHFGAWNCGNEEREGVARVLNVGDVPGGGGTRLGSGDYVSCADGTILLTRVLRCGQSLSRVFTKTDGTHQAERNAVQMADRNAPGSAVQLARLPPLAA